MHVQPADVNTWLEQSKLSVDAVEVGQDVVASANVIGQLNGRFETSGWTDETNTPALVKQLIAMLIAATEYRRAYSEDLEDGTGLNWAQWLERAVAGYVSQILAGVIQLDELLDASDGLWLPAFYPNDDSSYEQPAKFSMATEF